MAGEWRSATVAELQRDGILRVEDGNHGEYRPRKDEFVSSGVAFIRAADMDGGMVLFDSASKINDVARKRITKGIGAPGDILLSHKGTVGKLGIAPEEAPPFVCSPQTTFWRTLDTNSLDRKYLYAFLRSPEFKAQLATRASETDMAPYVSLTSQRGFSVTLPPLGEQRAIAHILGTLDDKIELNRRRNQTLEAMARALFKDWFVDFGPVRAKMEARDPYLPADLWQLFPDRLDEEGKPEGWEMQPLSGLLTIIGGGTPKTSVDDYWGGDIPWFSVVDTPSASDVFVVATEKTITPQGLAGSSARLIPRGTTIISARGTVGNLAIAGRDMTFNQSCYGLRGAGGAGDYFVYLAAQQMVDQLKSMAHGSVFSTITRQTFEAIRRPVPPPTVLKAFEELVTGWFEAMLSGVEESRTLAQLRDTLLPKLISGELRIADTEKFLERVA